LHVMTEHLNQRVRTFTVGYSGFDDETSKARDFVEHYDTKHTEVFLKEPWKIFDKTVWHMDEPNGDPVSLPTYALSGEANKHVKMVLTGDGADETLGGYEHHKIMYLTHKMKAFRHLIKLGLKVTPSTLLNKYFKYYKLFGKKGMDRINTYLSCLDDRHTFADSYLNINNIFDQDEKKNLTGLSLDKSEYQLNKATNPRYPLRSKILQTDINYFLQHLLLKADKMTMAHGLEARVPFLDHRLIELEEKMPNSFKFSGFKDKIVLREAFKNDLPKGLHKKRKQRFFTPQHLWVQEDWIKKDVLNREALLRCGLRPKYVTKAYKKFDGSKLYYSRQLWTLANYVKWHELFMQ